MSRQTRQFLRVYYRLYDGFYKLISKEIYQL